MRVDRKKNSTSCHFSTGRTDSAYAAGRASRMTSAVEPSVVHSELSRAALSPPLSTASNWSSVGEKANLGGDVKASRSCLKAVSTIHSTGKNIPSATIHPSADSSEPLRRELPTVRDSFMPPPPRPARARFACDLGTPTRQGREPPPPDR